MQERISKALAKRFEAHRLVFWYDEAREFAEVFEVLEVEGVEKLTIAGNEFALKHRVLREAPKQNFLLYKPGPRPDDVDNWLLDLELAYDLFRTDQVAIWLADLGLPANMDDLLRTHAEFFRSAKRLEALKARGRKTVMIGDGLNDAPALAGAHASLSPSSATQISQSAADVIFQGAQLMPVIETLSVAKASKRMALQNFAIAAGYNTIFVPLAMAGIVTPLIAAIAMSASSIAVTANAIRLRTKRLTR
ncbi:MAG: hypothetical protein L3J74_06265 [Bacteroidales bacterium]|nr:hypothetical protein [Bacteroidales bacterium]